MEYITMPRFATILLVLSAYFLHAYSDSDPTDIIDKLKKYIIYAEVDSIKESSDSLSCKGVEGRVSECSECYTCDSRAVETHRSQGHDINELTLNDIYCSSSERICCVAHRDIITLRESQNKSASCGRAKHEGYPRALRPAIRSVLQGEYPWRAWIYDALEPGAALCAAVYVNKEGGTLLTTASCVEGRAPHELLVRFDRSPNEYHPLSVNRVDVHEGYDRSSHVNDVAVLSVAPTHVPTWAERACLPLAPAPHGTSCVAVADNDYSLNQVILLQSKCTKSGELLHPSLMCSAMHRGDYKPERGGALFCADEQSVLEIYTVYGLYAYSARADRVALNVNVTNFIEWINNKSLQYKSLYKRN